MTYELPANRAAGGLIGGIDVWTRERKRIVGQMVRSLFVQ